MLIGLTIISRTVYPIPNYLHPFFISVVASLLVTVLLSKGKAPSREEEEYRTELLKVPARERLTKDYKRDLVYAYLLIAAGIAITTLLIVFWAAPVAGLLGG